MEKLFINLTDRNSIVPPESVEEAMIRHFSDAVNLEWFFENGLYEAIFYLDNREYIAKFDSNAKLTDYRINLSLDEIPENIAQAVVFLASDAAKYITGHILGVNGGLYM